MKPGGRVVTVATMVTLILAFDADSRMSFGMFVLAAVAGLVAIGLWLWRLVASRPEVRESDRRRAWPWLVAPSMLLAGALATSVDLPFQVRLELSRAAMTDAATAVAGGAAVEDGWIGLYPAHAVEAIPGGARFLVSGSGFIDRIGFAYLAGGEPPDEYGDRLEPLGGGWWLWISRF